MDQLLKLMHSHVMLHLEQRLTTPQDLFLAQRVATEQRFAQVLAEQILFVDRGFEGGRDAREHQ